MKNGFDWTKELMWRFMPHTHREVYNQPIKTEEKSSESEDKKDEPEKKPE